MAANIFTLFSRQPSQMAGLQYNAK